MHRQRQRQTESPETRAACQYEREEDDAPWCVELYQPRPAAANRGGEVLAVDGDHIAGGFLRSDDSERDEDSNELHRGCVHVCEFALRLNAL